MNTDGIGIPSPDAASLIVPGWCEASVTAPVHRRAASCEKVGCPPLQLPAGLVCDLGGMTPPMVAEGPDVATRAVHYAASLHWDGTRGLIAAWEVETGKDFGQVIPTWDDLTYEDQIEFCALISNASLQLSVAAKHVAGHWSTAGQTP